MRLLDDSQWYQVECKYRKALAPLEGKRNVHARYACKLLGEGVKDVEMAHFEAGYAHALEWAVNHLSSLVVELEEYLHPFDDDEVDIREFCEEDESCDD